MARKKTTKARRGATSRATRPSTRPRKPAPKKPATKKAAPKTEEAEQDCDEVLLEFPFGFPVEAVHCPACGERVVGAEGAEGCPHTLYVFHSDVPEPLFVHPKLEAVMGPPDDDVPEQEQVDAFLAAQPSTTALRLSISTGGMACGPMWSTVHVGFELLGVETWLDDEDED